MLNELPLIVLPALMMLAAATDIASFRIPNWLTGLTAALFFPMAWLQGMPMPEFWLHLKAGGILFFAGFALYALRLVGGGDAKLMAAAGLWLGMSDMMSFLLLTAIAGGLLAFTYIVWASVSVLRAGPSGEATSFRKRIHAMAPKLPYGCALAVGAILALPASWWAETAKLASSAAG